MKSADLPSSAVARGASRLAFEAVRQVTQIVESMHATIAAPSSLFATHAKDRTRGIPSLVYGSTRLITDVSRTMLDGALRLLPDRPLPASRTDAASSALNGVLGDHLTQTGNPLAIEMRLRSEGQPLSLEREALAVAFSETTSQATSKILVVVHGLCMSDRQMRRNDQDHGAALAHEFGFTPIYLHYNSGRHISLNGRDYAALLEKLVRAWPVPVTDLSVLAHSMGGLVTRSACHYAALAEHRWLAFLERIVFLGTPHHGAPLERGGHAFLRALGISPYTAPLARLGWLRSAGITDLRYGNLIDEDWQEQDRFAGAGDLRESIPLPEGVRCYALAASTGQARGDLKDRFLGDGLVPVASALGRHRDPARTLAIPESRQSIRYGSHHMDLLCDPEVYRCLAQWFGSIGRLAEVEPESEGAC